MRMAERAGHTETRAEAREHRNTAKSYNTSCPPASALGGTSVPTTVRRRPGRFPVRLSLNLTEMDEEILDLLASKSGYNRSVLAREAIVRGLEVVERIANRQFGRGSATPKPNRPA